MRLFKQMSGGKLLPLLLLVTLIAVSCDNDDSTEPQDYDVQINSTSLGNVLTDSEGRTLYFFTRDTDGSSACSGGCLENWPVFSPDELTLPSGLASQYFATITRGDGQTQLTYKGWPLYYFSGDAAAGDVNGENVGGRWFVAKPDYDVMLAEQEVNGQETRYLVDDTGESLYTFTNDGPNESNCTGGCLENWPIFNVENIVAPSILNASDFSSFDNSGTAQATFQTRPLYYFANDNVRGDVNGHQVNSVWFLEPVQ